MESKKFSGTKIVIASSLYILVMLIGASFFNPIYAFYPDFFKTDLVGLTTAITVCQIVGFVSGLGAAKVYRIFRPKICMIIGGACLILYGLVIANIQNVWGFALGMGIQGINCGMFTHGLTTDLLMRWYVKKRSSMVAFVIGIASFGVAAGTAVGTFCYNTLGMSVYQINLIVPAILGVLAILTAVLLVHSDPADVGQKPYGADDPEVLAQIKTQEEAAGNRTKTPFKELLGNPVFWCLVGTVVFANTAVAYCNTWLGLYTIELGGNYAWTTTTMTIMGFTSAIFMTLAGKIIEKTSLKFYVYLACLGGVVCNLSLIYYGSNSSILALVGIGIGYTAGFGLTTMENIVCPMLFTDKDIASEANTKLLALVFGCSAVLGPVMASIATAIGYKYFWVLNIAFLIIIIICYMLAFRFAKKSGADI